MKLNPVVRRCIFMLIALLSSAGVWSGQIDIHVSGISSDEGQARIVLMRGRAEYDGRSPVMMTRSVLIRDGTARLQIDVPAGNYTILAHHDRNADNTLDRPVFSLPIESYGYSNRAWTSFGLPAFNDVVFTVGEGASRQHIRLRTNIFVTLAHLTAAAAIALTVLFIVLALVRRYPFPKHHST